MEISVMWLGWFVTRCFIIFMVAIFWYCILFYTDDPNDKPTPVRYIVWFLPLLLLVDKLFIGFIKWTM